MKIKSVSKFDENGFLVCSTSYTCNTCRHRFMSERSEDESLLRLDCSDEVVRWLPIYGENGYLRLLERLVAGVDSKELITAAIAQEFEREFVLLQELGHLPFKCVIAKVQVCPCCNGSDLHIDDETVELKKSLEILLPV